MTRVSTIALQNFSIKTIETLQARMAERSIQVSTNKAAQRFSGIAADARRLVNLKTEHSRLSQFMTNNQLVDQRLQVMETNTTQIFDITTDLRTTLVQALSGGVSTAIPLQDIAQSMLDRIQGLLNVQVGGRYLFAGSITNRPPVDFTDSNYTVPGPAIPSAADKNYYQGDATKLSTRASDNLTLAYGINADETGFEEIIRALQLVITTNTSPPPDEARLSEALRVVNLALDDIPPLVARIGGSRSSLESANTEHDETLLLAERSINDLENVDIVKAITLLSADRLTLEASFAALAQMRDVSLVNFL